MAVKDLHPVRIIERYGPEFWIAAALAVLMWHYIMLDGNEEAWNAGEVFKVSLLVVAWRVLF